MVNPWPTLSRISYKIVFEDCLHDRQLNIIESRLPLNDIPVTIQNAVLFYIARFLQTILLISPWKSGGRGDFLVNRASLDVAARRFSQTFRGFRWWDGTLRLHVCDQLQMDHSKSFLHGLLVTCRASDHVIQWDVARFHHCHQIAIGFICICLSIVWFCLTLF